MMEEQLILWVEPLEVRLNRRFSDFEGKIEDKGNRQRKCQFAKIGEIKKEQSDLRYEFEQLKSAICKAMMHYPVEKAEVIEMLI